MTDARKPAPQVVSGWAREMDEALILHVLARLGATAILMTDARKPVPQVVSGWAREMDEAIILHVLARLQATMILTDARKSLRHWGFGL